MRNALLVMLSSLLASHAIGADPAVPGAPAPARSFTEYYVAPHGDDAQDGSRQRPWRHIPRAARTVRPGSRVNVLPGFYPEPSAIEPGSGTESAPIEFLASGAVTIDGSGIPPGRWRQGVFNLERVAYVSIRGFGIVHHGDGGALAGTNRCGINVYRSHHISVSACRVDSVGESGIMIYNCLPRAILIRDNESSHANISPRRYSGGRPRGPAPPLARRRRLRHRSL